MKMKISRTAAAKRLNRAFARDDMQTVSVVLHELLVAQNVLELAARMGLRRDSLYRSFNGKADPRFTTVVKLLAGVGLQVVVKVSAIEPTILKRTYGRPSFAKLRERERRV
jgi:probable addiction module antidote protein